MSLLNLQNSTRCFCFQVTSALNWYDSRSGSAVAHHPCAAAANINSERALSLEKAK